jgi:hypothetical protein
MNTTRTIIYSISLNIGDRVGAYLGISGFSYVINQECVQETIVETIVTRNYDDDDNDSVLLSDIDMDDDDNDSIPLSDIDMDDDEEVSDEVSLSQEELEAEEIRLETRIREAELRLSSFARNCDRLVEPEIIVAAAAA